MEEIMRALGGDVSRSQAKISRIGEIAVLKDALSAFQVRHEFRVGQIIRQKPQCTLYAEHSDNLLAIVVEVLPEPIVCPTADVGTSHYRDPQDMIVGVRAPDEKFVFFHVDSRRYEPAPLDD